MQLVTEGIGARTRNSSDLALLEETFGPLKLIHHRREDVVEQAVSWARAEQSGYWQQGDVASLPPRFDARLVHTFVETIQEHEAGWRSWFDREGVEPLVVTYEGLVADRRGTVERIFDHIGVEPPPGSPHRRTSGRPTRSMLTGFAGTGNFGVRSCSDASMQDLTQLR
jgi:LPS sulfotransferase NodH